MAGFVYSYMQANLSCDCINRIGQWRYGEILGELSAVQIRRIYGFLFVSVALDCWKNEITTRIMSHSLSPSLLLRLFLVSFLLNLPIIFLLHYAHPLANPPFRLCIPVDALGCLSSSSLSNPASSLVSFVSSVYALSDCDFLLFSLHVVNLFITISSSSPLSSPLPSTFLALLSFQLLLNSFQVPALPSYFHIFQLILANGLLLLCIFLFLLRLVYILSLSISSSSSS